MSYENAPATTILATHCACCARPLLDAKSVEIGMGPTCRKKHGFDRPDLDIELSSLTIPVPAEVSADTVRTIANKVVHRIALAVSSNDLHPIKLAGYLTLLRNIGFSTLAGKLAKAACKVKIEETDSVLIVKSAFSQEFVQASRSIPGRRWDGINKVNTFPLSSKPQLFAALRQCYAGTVGEGSKGFFAL